MDRMSNITVTDKQDISMMKTDDIRTWISLHQRGLKDEAMQEHWEAIQQDLNILMDEYHLRFPMLYVLKDISGSLSNIENHLRLLVKIKEKEKEKDGTKSN